MVIQDTTPQQVLSAVPPEYLHGIDPRSWLNVSKGLLGWALGTLRLAVREASAFFQMYKHARKDNEKLRKILADHGIAVPAYDWKLDEELIIGSHTAIPLGLWDDPDVGNTGPFFLTTRNPQQLLLASQQTAALDEFLGGIRNEFYSREISQGGWSVKKRLEDE